MDRFAPLPDPPYFAVIFSAMRTDGDDGYGAMANKMMEMALDHPGCIGAESARDPDGFGVTISYWRDEAAIVDWKANAKHLVAQSKGKTAWYSHYRLRVARVDRHYAGPEGR